MCQDLARCRRAAAGYGAQTVDIGPQGEGRTDSLVLCYPEGNRLIGLDCKVRESCELTCGARYSLTH